MLAALIVGAAVAFIPAPHVLLQRSPGAMTPARVLLDRPLITKRADVHLQVLGGNGGGNGGGGDGGENNPFGGDDHDDEEWDGTDPMLAVAALVGILYFGRGGGKRARDAAAKGS